MKAVTSIVFAALLLLGPAVQQGTSQQQTVRLSGGRAPSFSLPDAAFKRYDLLDYRGKWLLIDFMSTSCPHCEELSTKLEGLKRKLGDAKVGVLSVVIAPPETQQTVAAYVNKTKITSPIVFDQGQMAASYFKASPQNRSGFDTPHLFAINPQGLIVKDWGQAAAGAPGLVAELEALVK